MNLTLPAAAQDFAASARRAFGDAGGVALHRRAEVDPSLRDKEVGALLGRLGVYELEMRGEEESRLAGAELCRMAGAVALPYPVVGLLARSPDVAGGSMMVPASGGRAAVLEPDRQWVDHGDLGAWVVVDGEGRLRQGTCQAVERNGTLGPFVVPLELGGRVGEVEPGDWALLVILDAWRVLGVLEGAQEMTIEHVRSRQQFGHPLATLQGVQFHVADNEVAVRGLRQLARWTIWRWADPGGHRRADALALRVVALEAAQRVLRTCHLLHGAVGFCNEHDLTVLSRSVAPSLRLPDDLEETSDQLAGAVDRDGFDGLFGAPVAPAGRRQ